jgi:hypothetical protein
MLDATRSGLLNLRNKLMKHFNIVTRISLFMLILLPYPRSISFPIYAHPPLQQQTSHLEPIEITNCELTILMLDSLAKELEDGVVIAVARLGDGERNLKMNSRRLHNIRAYLTKFLQTNRLLDQQVITAVGERVKGLGRVEIYMQGKLYGVLAVTRNKDLTVGLCEGKGNELFYPWHQK